MQITDNIKLAVERLKEAHELLSKAVQCSELSTIERDLALEKVRKAYDLMLFDKDYEKEIILEAQESKVSKEEASLKVEPAIEKVTQEVVKPIEEPRVLEEKKNKPKASERVSIFDPSIKGLSKVGETKIVENVEKIFDEIKEAKVDEFSILKTDKPESLVEKFQGKRKTMTDALSNQIKEKPVAAQLQEKPISELRKEIGVHDKFLFIKELFNGDSNKYEQTIEKLDQFKDISDALIFIQENFTWNENSKAAVRFIELLRRKLLND